MPSHAKLCQYGTVRRLASTEQSANGDCWHENIARSAEREMTSELCSHPSSDKERRRKERDLLPKDGVVRLSQTPSSHIMDSYTSPLCKSKE